MFKLNNKRIILLFFSLEKSLKNIELYVVSCKNAPSENIIKI